MPVCGSVHGRGHTGLNLWFSAEIDNDCIIKNKYYNFPGSCITLKNANILKVLIFKIRYLRNGDICGHRDYVLESCAFTV